MLAWDCDELANKVKQAEQAKHCAESFRCNIGFGVAPSSSRQKSANVFFPHSRAESFYQAST